MNDANLMTFEYKDDILIARYISKKPITKEVAIEIVRQRKEFSKGEAKKVMIVFPHLTNMDKGGRDYMSSDEAAEGILASAMVTNTVIGKVIINFFLKLNNNNRHDIPNQVFSNEEDALKWLKNLDLN